MIAIKKGIVVLTKEIECMWLIVWKRSMMHLTKCTEYDETFDERDKIYECTNTDVLSCFKMTKLY